MTKEYTSEQMELWGKTNLLIGACVMPAVHLIMGLLGAPPFDWVWQGIMLMILAPLTYFQYRQYQRTKEKDE